MGVKSDLHNNIEAVQSIAAQGLGGGVTGSNIDLQNRESLDIHMNLSSGSNDGDYSVDIQESTDGGSTFSSVASDDLEGSFSSDLDDGNDKMERVGYLGTARHVRVVVNENTAATTAPTASFTLVAGDLKYAGQAPVSKQT